MKSQLFQILFFNTALFFTSSFAQLATHTINPTDAKIVHTDLNNFITAFNLLQFNSDTVTILQKEYIDKATPGLSIFIEKYGLNANNLAKAIQKHSVDYAAIPKKLAWLKTQEDSIRAYFKKFKQFIPKAVFPPTYYLVGRRRGIGSGSIEGQLITIEKEAKRIIDPGIKTHIVHELVHLNQLQAIGSLKKYLAIYNTEKSLLAITIREGIAEFFAELITGKYTQDEAYFYTRSNEQKLWRKFQLEMLGKETSEWMWKKPADPKQPRDVAYLLGAFIVEHYYKSSIDLDATLADILSVTDYPAFLQRTGYASKFQAQ